jgi:hypothetical protein
MAIGSTRRPSSGTSWECPNCHRRVPRYAGVCHCGTRRADAELLAAARSARPALMPRARVSGQRFAPFRGLPASFWMLVAVILLSVVGMAYRLFFQHPEPERIFPLMGHADRFSQRQPSPPKPTRARR